MKIEKQFQDNLLRWYVLNKRSLPWRDTSDPYKIWISEIMLQQTQVATVEDYYLRFMEKLPTVRHLAKAKLSTIIKVWEGLGYYGRIRNIHAAAREIILRFNGEIPDSMNGLLSLPGVGRYTAGAILSIAFGQRAPVIDGNVIRVLTRVLHLTDNVSRTKTKSILWQIAESLLPEKHVGDYNQAVMELGALVCKPKNPLCQSCPVKTLCEAFRLSIQESLPVKTPRQPVPHYDVTAGVIWKENRFLITLRPPKGLLGGLWEFPGGKKESNESLEQCLEREIREELGILIKVGERLIFVKHAYSHFRITLHVYECKYISGKVKCFACDDFRWITEKQLDDFAFPAADRKVIQKLRMTSNK